MRSHLPAHTSDLVHTTDSFQGREADIIIVSLVRTNDTPPDNRLSRVGHLASPQRTKVLLSRAKQLLIIVGDCDHFKTTMNTPWRTICQDVEDANARVVLDVWRPYDMSEVTATSRHGVIIPCETLTATVVFAPSDVPTKLEELVLTAIHKGARTIGELNVIFSIGTRPMLRLVLDLLNRSLVSFNFGTGEIHLTQYVSELIDTNMLREIGSSDRTFKRVSLLRDLIAGTILPRRKRGNLSRAQRLPALLVQTRNPLSVLTRSFAKCEQCTRAKRHGPVARSM
jgi:hypothetical protein